MTTTEEQVLELIAQGKITASEGDQLLAAMRGKARSRWRRMLNPFERLQPPAALGLGAAGAAVGVLLSRWGIRFDGALDVHLAPGAAPLRDTLADLLVAWPLTATLLFGVARLLRRPARWIDLLGFVGVARLPLLAVAGVAFALQDRLPKDAAAARPEAVGWVLALAGLTLPLIAWNIAWLYQGYRTASGLAGVKAGLSFTLALVAAEVGSKLVLQLIP